MAHIPISGELTIYQVGELKPLIAQALEQCAHDLSPLQLDLAGVTEIDGAGLQLLLATAKSVLGSETALSLHHVPQAVQELFDTYHVANRFTVVQEANHE